MEVDVRDLHDSNRLPQLAQQLGVTLSAQAKAKELESYEFDENNARGQLGTSK